MVDRNFLITPTDISVTFSVAPALNALYSIKLLRGADYVSGLANWVYETIAQLTAEELLTHDAVVEMLFDGLLVPGLAQLPDFDTYLEQLAKTDSQQLRDAAMSWMRKIDDYPGDEALLASFEVFQNVIKEHFAHKGPEHEPDEALLQRVHSLLQAPSDMHEAMVRHLAMLWEVYLKDEWERVKGLLEASVRAFEQVDLSGLTAPEIVQYVTGRDVSNMDITAKISDVQHLLFVPSQHIGPYIGWMPSDKPDMMYIIYTARVPKGTQSQNTALDRSQLLIRMNALADETRLRMLELLTEHNELCAQDFINMLELSQSSASRHLRQLTATGFVKERRRDVAKCYSLNRERIQDLLEALELFFQN